MQEFQHLQIACSYSFNPEYPKSSRLCPAEVQYNKDHPDEHSAKLSKSIGAMCDFFSSSDELRKESGLSFPAGKGFLLAIPEDVSAEAIAHSLGVELVAETSRGFVFVATEDLSLEKLRSVIEKFRNGQRGGGAAAQLLDIDYAPGSENRLRELFGDELYEKIWPLKDDCIYTFDISIQVAQGTREFRDTIALKTDMEIRFDEAVQKREIEIYNLVVLCYKGEILDQTQDKVDVGFPDTIEFRIKMSGRGFRDLILNSPHLIEVSSLPELELPEFGLGEGVNAELEVLCPGDNAPAVCIIDSGIQEGHRWLAPAMDTQKKSKCFIPNDNEVADYVSPDGHGTRVAGAVLYPKEIAKSEKVVPVAKLQNARVLDKQCALPLNLRPSAYLARVVSHFEGTKIFNQSINERRPFKRQRMSSWAAKIDQLSYEKDILFIQSAGNLSRDLLSGTSPHPAHLLQDNAGVANPAQSLHALTVGSVSRSAFDDGVYKSFARWPGDVSSFSRAGFAMPWNTIKPDVVEFGGDWSYEKKTGNPVPNPKLCEELLRSTLEHGKAYSGGFGTSFSTPKVTHIAAQLAQLFPAASPLLYRALIIQSARWPEWTHNENPSEVARLIGYGIPDLERATRNSTHRVTLITSDAVEISNKQFHLYSIKIPNELRSVLLDSDIRLEVTLAYASEPRRTRVSSYGYLETWLDWFCSAEGEDTDAFIERIKKRVVPGKDRDWVFSNHVNAGDVRETRRRNGTAQKDWTIIKAHALPEEFSLAVRAHKGWNHRDGHGNARYCLVVSFEDLGKTLPVYNSIRNELVLEQKIELV